MKNLDRSSSSVTSSQSSAFNIGKLTEELESYKHQAEEHWQKFEEADAEAENSKKEAEQASTLAERRNEENKGLIQRLFEAITSRDSMRGRLGNMTMQRNQALKRAEDLLSQNKAVNQQLKSAMEKLGESYQQIELLQEESETDNSSLADAYRHVSPELRAKLPQNIRDLLDQIEDDYRQ